MSITIVIRTNVSTIATPWPACESIDYALSMSLGIGSGVLFGIIGLFARSEMGALSLLAFPFFVMVMNHLYLAYVATTIDSLPIMLDWMRFTPMVLAGVITLLSTAQRVVLEILFFAGASVFMFAKLEGVFNYAGIAAVTVGLTLLSYLPGVRRYVTRILISLVLFATYVVLVVSLWTPDPAPACGAPRNKFVLCHEECSVLTLEQIVYPLAIGVTLGAGVAYKLVVMLVYWWYRKSRGLEHTPLSDVELD